MAVGAFASQAIAPEHVFEGEYYFKIVPTNLGHKGEATLYVESDESDENKYVYNLYSEAFEAKGTVSFEATSVETGTKYQFYRPVFDYINYYFESGQWDFTSLDAAKQWVTTDMGWTINMLQAESGVYFFFRTEETQPAELAALKERTKIESYLKKHHYCDEYAVYTQSDNRLSDYQYQDTRYSYTGEHTDELVEVKEHSDSHAYGPMGIYPFETNNVYDLNELGLTQTLFNDDEDYEALMPIVEAIETTEETTYQGNFEGEWIEIPAKRIETSAKATGYKVVKGNTGEVVMTFETPADFEGSAWEANMFTTSSGDKYLLLGGYDTLLVYDLSAESGSVKSPMLIESVKVRPSVVNQGEEISVEVSDNAEIKTVMVTDMKGASRRVAPNAGKRNATINTGRLGRGMHIVGVETSNGTQSEKVIVR